MLTKEIKAAIRGTFDLFDGLSKKTALTHVDNGGCLVDGSIECNICRPILKAPRDLVLRYIDNLRPNRNPTSEALRKKRWYRENKAAGRSLNSVQEVG